MKQYKNITYLLLSTFDFIFFIPRIKFYLIKDYYATNVANLPSISLKRSLRQLHVIMLTSLFIKKSRCGINSEYYTAHYSNGVQFAQNSLLLG